GDFFDFWFSKGEEVYPPFREVLDRLIALQGAGIGIHLSEGNHDFFLADYFSDYLGMEVYPDWVEVELDGRKILLSHGDTITAGDLSYRILRGVLRSRLFYKLQRLIPLSVLFAIARISSRTSRELGGDRSVGLAEEFHAFAREKLVAGFDAVVLGHCHLPLLRQHRLGGREAISATLGGWNFHQSYLYYEEGTFRQCAFQKGKYP
ncbi:MAG: UDP-2,3-diacylglucosamine diphosphatase, partial [Smithellaceae bacterium]|nr:UDP-2,3-diacylglucosamine diphosphatase [Smithellaceae bacterium]